MTAEVDPVLEIRQMSKTFGVNRALKAVDLRVLAGEVHGLIGANGSGKSTLVKILAGYHSADSDGAGSVTIAGERVPEGELRGRADVRFVHQDLALEPSMTVAENMALADYAGSMLSPVRPRSENCKVVSRLKKLGLDIDPDAKVSQLSPLQRTLLAVARAMFWTSSKIELLVLDEVTSTLPPDEVGFLMRTIRQHTDMGVVIVSHRIEEILTYCDAITVLRDGAVVATRPTAGLDEASLVRLITGTSAERLYTNESPPPGDEALLKLQGFSSGGVTGLDLEVAAGEIVGLASIDPGLASGVLRGLYGDRRASWDRFQLGIEVVRSPVNPKKMTRLGVSLVADRVETGISTLSVRENMSLSSIRKYFRRGYLDAGLERADTTALARSYGVKPDDVDLGLSALSGGNQQKVVLAKSVLLGPKLLLLDEPTRGVDVGAKAALYRIIREVATSGVGVILASTEFDELVHLCGRVIVLKGGRTSGEYSTEGLDAHRLLELTYLGPAEAGLSPATQTRRDS